MPRDDEYDGNPTIDKWLSEDGRGELDKAEELAKARIGEIKLDEFDQMSELDEEYKDQEKDIGVVDLTSLSQPSATNKQVECGSEQAQTSSKHVLHEKKRKVNMHAIKQQTDRIKHNAPLFDSDYPFYARNMPFSKMMLEEDSSVNKPHWAVDCLVKLRDMAMCRICGLFDARGVVKLLPGLKYDEPGCLFVCRECDKCWSKVINLANQLTFEHKLLKLRLFLLKKRAMCVNGSDGIVGVSSEEVAKMRSRFELLNTQSKSHAEQAMRVRSEGYGEILSAIREENK